MRPVRLLGASCALLFAAAGMSGVAVTGQAAADTGPAFPTQFLAVTGSVAGVDDLTDASVIAFALPDDQLVRTFDTGDAVHPSLLPDEDVFVDGNQYFIVVDPAFLPAGTVGSTGLVNFRVMVQDPDGATYAVIETTSRAVTGPDGRWTWADPLQPNADEPSEGIPVTTGDSVAARASQISRLSKTKEARRPVGLTVVTKPRPTKVNIPVPRIKGQLCTNSCAPVGSARAVKRIQVAGWAFPAAGPVSRLAAVDPEDDPEPPGKGDIDEPAVFSRGGCPAGGLGDVVGPTRSWQITIGTAYPRGGGKTDTAWMTYNTGSSAEFTTKLGGALKDYGATLGWQASGSRTLEKGSGFDWDPKNYTRSFRITGDYQRVDHYYDRCPGDKPYFSNWNPKKLNTGGYGENKDIARPDWGNCKTIYSDGNWWRQTNGGTSYSYDAGVKAGGTIGIDLSVVRAYNEEARLGYHINANRRMCGNNKMGDPVAAAGKVQEKLYLSD